MGGLGVHAHLLPGADPLAAPLEHPTRGRANCHSAKLDSEDRHVRELPQLHRPCFARPAGSSRGRERRGIKPGAQYDHRSDRNGHQPPARHSRRIHVCSSPERGTLDRIRSSARHAHGARRCNRHSVLPDHAEPRPDRIVSIRDPRAQRIHPPARGLDSPRLLRDDPSRSRGRRSDQRLHASRRPPPRHLAARHSGPRVGGRLCVQFSWNDFSSRSY